MSMWKLLDFPHAEITLESQILVGVPNCFSFGA